MSSEGSVRIGLLLPVDELSFPDHTKSWLISFQSDLTLLWKRFFRQDPVLEKLTLREKDPTISSLQQLANSQDVFVVLALDQESGEGWLDGLYGYYLAGSPGIPVCLLHRIPLAAELSFWGMFHRIYSLEEIEPAILFRKKRVRDSREAYWDRLTNLVLDIQRLITPVVTKKTSGRNILVTQTGKAESGDRQGLLYELETLDFRVLPESPLPFLEKEMEHGLEQSLKQADLIIEVLGDIGRDSRMSDQTSVSLFQHRIIAAFNRENQASGRTVPRLLWVPPTEGKTSEEQTLFLEKLFRGGEDMIDAEIIQAPLEQLKKVIRKKITGSGMLQVAPDADEPAGRLYLIAEPSFRQDAEKLQAGLVEMGQQVSPSWETDGEERQIGQHYRNLVSHQGVLLYYPGGREWWLNSMLQDLLKAPGYTRKPGRIRSAIYTTSQEEISIPPMLQVPVLRGKGAFSGDIVAPFIQTLNA